MHDASPQVAKMILMVVLAFAISWTPYFLVSIITQYATVNYMNNHNFFFTMLSINFFGFLNSSINPVIYVIMSTRFRTGFTRILRLVFCANCSDDGSGSVEGIHSSVAHAIAAAAANSQNNQAVMGSRDLRGNLSNENHQLIFQRQRRHCDNNRQQQPIRQEYIANGDAIIRIDHQNDINNDNHDCPVGFKRKRETSLAMIGRYHRRLVLLACGGPSNVSTDSCPTDSGHNEAILLVNEHAVLNDEDEERISLKEDRIYDDHQPLSSCDSTASSASFAQRKVNFEVRYLDKKKSNKDIIETTMITNVSDYYDERNERDMNVGLGTRTSSSQTNGFLALHLNKNHHNAWDQHHHNNNHLKRSHRSDITLRHSSPQPKMNHHQQYSHPSNIHPSFHSQEYFHHHDPVISIEKKTDENPEQNNDGSDDLSSRPLVKTRSDPSLFHFSHGSKEELKTTEKKPDEKDEEVE